MPMPAIACDSTGPVTLGGTTFNLRDKHMTTLLENRGAKALIFPLMQQNAVVSESSGRFSTREYGSLYGIFRAGGAVQVGQNTFIKQELAQFQPTFEGADNQAVKRAIRVSYLDEMANQWPAAIQQLRHQVDCVHGAREITDATRAQAMRALDALTWLTSQAKAAASAMRNAGVDVIYADVMTQTAWGKFLRM